MISVDNLTFSYTGGPPYVLENLSLSIANGEYVSIVGDNGSGKSTLLRLLLRLLRPTGGTIDVGAKQVGYVPQKTDAALSQFPITVREALDSYRRILGVRGRRAVDDCLAQVGMTHAAGQLMGNLSGGQHQKILIARALLGSPDLILLDEPSTGVDRDSQREIYGLLARMNREKGRTIVSVEHNLEAAVAHSTLIYHLSGGRGHLCSPDQYAAEYLRNVKKEDPHA